MFKSYCGGKRGVRLYLTPWPRERKGERGTMKIVFTEWESRDSGGGKRWSPSFTGKHAKRATKGG